MRRMMITGQSYPLASVRTQPRGVSVLSTRAKEREASQDTFLRSAPFNLATLKEQTKKEAARLAANMPPHRPKEVLLKLPPLEDFSSTDEGDLFRDFHFTSSREIVLPSSMQERIGGRLMLVELPRELSVAEAVAALNADGRTLSAEANHIVTNDKFVLDTGKTPGGDDGYRPPPGAPIDLRPTQWNLHNEGQTGGRSGAHVSAMGAWAQAKGSGVVIALLDTGVDLTNPDLKPNLWVNPAEIPGDGMDNDNNGYIDDVHGINLVDRAAPPQDDNGHGSYNASVIAAVEGNDPKGLVGLAPQAKLMPIKFMESGGRGDIAAAIEGIAYAEANGARIVLNGWMTRTQNQSLFEVIGASEALHVCSAGNDGQDNDLRPVHPASFPLPNVLSVAATDHHDDFTPFTNRGPHTVDMAAPGRKVPVYDQVGKLLRQGGASIAAAHVAAAAALIVSKFPDLTNESLATRLVYNGDTLVQGADRIASGRRLNAAAALRDDESAPRAPGGFSVTAKGGSRLQFDFHTVSDDAGISKEPVAFYEARISSKPIVADGEAGEGSVTFSQATVVPLELERDLTPGRAITTEYSVGPSGKERNFHLAIRATDKVGNRSPLSNAEVVMAPSQVVFEDGFELSDGVEDPWTMEGEWARIPVPGRGMVMTDSPHGDYKNDTNASLYAPVIDLKNVRKAKLHFDARYTIEPKHDGCFVEVETNGWFGKKWKKIATLDGFSDWKNQEVDLSPYTGKDLKLRFRMETDRDRVAYGVQLDHLSITTER